MLRYSEDDIKSLCLAGIEIFNKIDNIETVNSPVTLVGDIHGQWYDLLEMFELGGPSPYTNYVFLGDYVDRGYHSLEVVTLVISLKVRYPNRVHVIRGNHETRSISQVYGFYDQCLRIYGNSNVWKYFTDLFDSLPLSVLIDNKIFGIHGGLSPNLKDLKEIDKLHRFAETQEGPLSDLLWSDPDEIQGWQPSPRGAGFIFGEDISKKWNHLNGVILTARAHQLVLEGYQYWHSNQILTIFSAPNYCYRCGNQAAIMEVSEDLSMVIKQFNATNKDREVTTHYQMLKPDYFM